MGYPKANWATVMNIGKSLIAVEVFYHKTCDLMKELLLPVPFVKDSPQEREKPSFIYHTIFDFVCAKLSQVLENEDLSHASLQAVSEILSYFKEKQIKEYKNNFKITQNNSNVLLEKLAEAEIQFSRVLDLSKENLKKDGYKIGIKRKKDALFEPAFFSVDEAGTEYVSASLPKEGNNAYDDYLTISEIRSKCLPIEQIPEKLLKKCKEESPSPSLFIFNLPKNCIKVEILELFQQVFPSVQDVQILKGKLKGQGFIHLESKEQAQQLKDTFFGFPFKGKPLILQFSKTINCN